MASNLVQLTFKPGIQRDGTAFQGDYCIDGQWVRFQRGKPKKIKGMKGASGQHIINLAVSEMLLYPDNNQIFYYLFTSTGVFDGFLNRDTFNTLAPGRQVLNGFNNALVKWSATTIIRNQRRLVVFLAANNAADIAQNTASRLYYRQLFAPANVQSIEVDISAFPLVNGGICYAAPFLFLYGSNGFVLWTSVDTPNNPITFPPNPVGGISGSVNISNDKVIYGAQIRGGSNSPTLLFWTLSSVVRFTNVGDLGDLNVEFKIDIISSSSSILSSKCVVEYDGLFFWCGAERFFVYNGIVQEMVNPASLNWFYDNIDMAHRQSVFGVKNTKYGEIWWFYPEKVGTPGRNPALPAGTNTRAIIYNKRENTWYDTAISRDYGHYSDDFGFLVTYGRSMTDPANPPVIKYLWRHEYNANETIEGANGFNRAITSSITTPIFGWSCFNPASYQSNAKSQLIDRWIELKRIEPNFLLARNENMTVTVSTQTYASSPIVESAAFLFNGATEKIDLRIQGRQMFLTFSSGFNFEMGNLLMMVGIGDGQ